MSSGDDLITAVLETYGAAQPLEYHHQQDFRSDDAVVERARKYVEKMPSAISGENGHKNTYHVACVLCKGFELTTAQAMDVLKEYNLRCDPPWSDYELQHKIDDAVKASGQSGYLRNTKPERWESVKVPEYRERPAQQKKQIAEKSGVSRPTRKSLRDAVAQSIEHSAAGKKNLINLGIPDLNKAIGGGAEFGEMIMIAARPSHGKSAIALQMIDQMTSDGIKCAFFSEEMNALTVGKRVLQFVSPVPETMWQANRQNLESQVSQHFGTRAECEVVENCRTAERIAEEVREMAARGVRAVVVDYVQLLASSGNRFETVTANSVILRKVCTETGVLMIVLAQMSRAIEGRDSFIPKTSDLRESGQLEQDADVLLFLVWPWKLNSEKPREEYLIFVSKNRNREIVDVVVKCKFEPARQRITGASPNEETYEWAETI
jgi:KaiC/GvpD/RAD55 family RecA-like ATPase